MNTSMNTKKRRVKKFRKLLVPRYLKGEVPEATRREDLKVFNKFRYECFIVEPKVDDSPPKFNPEKYLNVRRLTQDAERLRQIDKQNKQLLKAINTINRTTGKVDSWNPFAYEWKSSWKSHHDEMKKIEALNKEVYTLIRHAGSQYSHKAMQEHWKQFLSVIKQASRYPLTFINQPTTDSLLARLPSISGGIDKTSERPLCFLEFSIRDGPKLGRVVIELYHDYVPVTVQNFLTLCAEQPPMLSYKNCPVHRICPGKLVESGDITKGNGKGGKSIYGDSFFEEEHMLKHTKPGVLSMTRLKSVKNKKRNNSQFIITFGPMHVLDRRNVVFGKIVKGIDNFFKIEGYGRKIGKPLADVYISNCGKL